MAVKFYLPAEASSIGVFVPLYTEEQHDPMPKGIEAQNKWGEVLTLLWSQRRGLQAARGFFVQPSPPRPTAGPPFNFCRYPSNPF